MIEDKQRWNEKYSQKEVSENVSEILEKYVGHANVGMALDVACGSGRNTNFLAQKGFEVDAVDISNVALDKIPKRPTINKIEADLDKYNSTK